jgi:hypothetical protein
VRKAFAGEAFAQALDDYRVAVKIREGHGMRLASTY